MKTNPSMYKNSGTSPTLIIDEGVRPVILGGVVVNKEASTNHTPTPKCPAKPAILTNLLSIAKPDDKAG